MDTRESSLSDVRTFLIADIRGYTSFTLEHGDEAAARLAASFAMLARDVVAARDGAVIEIGGGEVLADALRIQGTMLTQQEKWDEAEAAFEEAISLSRRMPYPYAEARALDEGALMHRLNSQPDQARQRLIATLSLLAIGRQKG